MTYTTLVSFRNGQQLETELDEDAHEFLTNQLDKGRSGWVSVWSETEGAGLFLNLSQVLYFRWS